MEHNKAAWPNWFPAEFYQKDHQNGPSRFVQYTSCWTTRIFCLNFSEIILLPKVNEAKKSNNIDIYVSLMLV
jgi:hypothetical protein